MWVRGLKLFGVVFCDGSMKSHPMWVRGLKPRRAQRYRAATCVAPYVGAWIETQW